MAISDLVIKFGATGAAQTVTLAEQVYAAMPVGFGTVTQDRWRANPVTVNGIVFTLFPGIDSDGRADCWIHAAYGEATAQQTYSPINREFATVDLQVTLGGVAQNLFGAGTTYTYDHQRTTWLRWQSVAMPWDTSHAFIAARIADGTFMAHDSRPIFGAEENSGYVDLPSVAAYQPFKVFSNIQQDDSVGDCPRFTPGGGERTTIGPVHEWFGRLISEVGTNNNPAWLTATRLQILKDLAETAAQMPFASGLMEPVTNRLLDPSIRPHCSHDNSTAWYGATGLPQPKGGTPSKFNGQYDSAHPQNKISFQAYHLSKDPFFLVQVQGQAVAMLLFQSLYGDARGADGKTLRLYDGQERGNWWGLQTLVQAWHATPAGTMPKPFRDKAWFATAINNTLQYLRDRVMSSTNHITGGVIGEAMRYWRVTSTLGPYDDGTIRGSRFQEDYGHIVRAQALLLGYTAARDVVEWYSVNMERRLALGGNWFLNDEYIAQSTGQLCYALGPSTGTLPYSTLAEYKAWYPYKQKYVNGPLTPADWSTVYGRDAFLFLAAVNVAKEVQRRGLITLGFNAAQAEAELRARFVPPYVTETGGALGVQMYAKQFFNYATASEITLPPPVNEGRAMPRTYIDLVEDVATSAGTGAFVPAGTPPQGWQAFSVHAVGDTFDYRARAGSQWEVGTGTWNGTNIARSVQKSSNGNALVNFTAPPTITEVVSAATVASFASVADGLTIGQLPAAPSILDSYVLELFDPSTGSNLKTTVAALRAAFGSTSTTTPGDTTKPTFASAQVSNATPTVVQITMSENLNASVVPAASAFTVSGGKTVSSVSISGAVVSLTCNAAYANGNAITVTYTKPGSGNVLQDLVGNAADMFGPSTVTNNIAAAGDTIVPTASSAAVANSAPSVVVITMSEPMGTVNVPAASAFTVSGHTVSSVAISGSTISLTVAEAFVNGEAARTVSYTQPGTNNARDLAGNLLANFSALAITNNVAAVANTNYVITKGFETVPYTTYSLTAADSVYSGYYILNPLAVKAQYWIINPAPNPATALTGWSLSNTVAPGAGGSFVNGMTSQNMDTTDPTHLNTGSVLYIAQHSGTTGPWFYWIQPAGGVAQCMNAGAGLMVTAA